MDYVIVWAGNKNRIKWRMKKGKNKTSRRLHINPRFEQREPCISIEKFQLSFPEIDGVWLTGMKNWGVWLITPYAERKSCMCINHRFSELVCCTCTWVMRESAIFYVVDFYFILSWQNLHIYRGLWYSVTHSQSKSENKCDITIISER